MYIKTYTIGSLEEFASVHRERQSEPLQAQK
jgi:hypothetical protein